MIGLGVYVHFTIKYSIKLRTKRHETHTRTHMQITIYKAIIPTVNNKQIKSIHSRYRAVVCSFSVHAKIGNFIIHHHQSIHKFITLALDQIIYIIIIIMFNIPLYMFYMFLCLCRLFLQRTLPYT